MQKRNVPFMVTYNFWPVIPHTTGKSGEWLLYFLIEEKKKKKNAVIVSGMCFQYIVENWILIAKSHYLWTSV